MPVLTSTQFRALEHTVDTLKAQWNALVKQKCRDDKVLDPLVAQYRIAKQQLVAARQERLEAEWRAVISDAAGNFVASRCRFENGRTIFVTPEGWELDLFGSNFPQENLEDIDFDDD